ncbi:FG-GAP repeat domain-containing protein [Streptomyces sp. NPDC018059]|uniref:FG-GAP repeat domain-containing protein n=1 Tax=Streptomyces sp. NPDC018059 TaxID=3365041 RepID=UPI003795DB28
MSTVHTYSRRADRAHGLSRADADLENDGRADLAVLRAEGFITGHRNVDCRFDGGTVWSEGWATYLAVPGQGSISFADVSGDGRADLVVHGTDGQVGGCVNLGDRFDAAVPMGRI